MGRSSSEERQSNQAKEPKEPTIDITSDDDEKRWTEAGKSRSEMKRLRIKKKYGISEDATIEPTHEDVEEFENVGVQVRPAKSKMRKHRMKWKTQDSDGTVGSFDEPSQGQGSNDSTTGSSRASATNETSSPDGKTQASESVSAIRAKSEKSLDDIPILLKRIDELENAQKNSIEVQKRLRLKIREQQKIIKELSDEINAQKPTTTIDEEEKFSEHEESIAKRALAIIRREQLLEKPLKFKELKQLNEFFLTPESEADVVVMRIVDKALTFAVDELLIRQRATGSADNEMRSLLKDKNKAKRLLLTMMMLNPEYIPESWGGDAMARRLQKSSAARKTSAEKLSAEKASAEKLSAEKPKVEVGSELSFLTTARQFIGYIFDLSNTTRPVETVKQPLGSQESTSAEKSKVLQPWEYDKAEPRRRRTRSVKTRKEQ